MPMLKSSMPSVAKKKSQNGNLANKHTGMVVLCDGATEATLKYERSSKIYDLGSAGDMLFPFVSYFAYLAGR